MKTTSLVLILILVFALQGCYTQLLIEESESASVQVEQPYVPFIPDPIIIIITDPCPPPPPVRPPWNPVPEPTPIIIRPSPAPQPTTPHRESGPQRTGSENSQQTQVKGPRTEGAKRSG